MRRLPRRRQPVVLAVAALATAGVVTALLLAPDGDPAVDPGTAAATTSGSAGASPSPGSTTAPDPASGGPTTAGSTTAAGPTAGAPAPAGQLPPELPPVALADPAVVTGVLTGRLSAVERIQATGVGVGNVAGPALRVTVQLTNDSDAALGLDGSYVELATGPELTPASPVEDPSVAPLQGELPAGGQAVGVYVFTVDEAAAGDVTVRVQQAPGGPFLVFRGAAG